MTSIVCICLFSCYLSLLLFLSLSFCFYLSFSLYISFSRFLSLFLFDSMYLSFSFYSCLGGCFHPVLSLLERRPNIYSFICLLVYYPISCFQVSPQVWKKVKSKSGVKWFSQLPGGFTVSFLKPFPTSSNSLQMVPVNSKRLLSDWL